LPRAQKATQIEIQHSAFSIQPLSFSRPWRLRGKSPNPRFQPNTAMFAPLTATEDLGNQARKPM
jgi:hypothetical protein